MNDLSKTIYELELSLLKPEVRASRSALDNLIADDFIEYGSSGNKYTKKDILDRLPQTTDTIVYLVSDFSITTPNKETVITHFKTERITNDTERVFSERISH